MSIINRQTPYLAHAWDDKRHRSFTREFEIAQDALDWAIANTPKGVPAIVTWIDDYAVQSIKADGRLS